MLTDMHRDWLDKEIWPEIHAMMHNDAYFRLWLKAQELAEMPVGPIGQTVINGYATYQLAAIRRMCDRSSTAISLPRLLNLIKKAEPCWKEVLDALSSRLGRECGELSALATQYVAHNGNPAKPNWREWSLTSNQIIEAQNAICRTAIVIERDVLAITQRTHVIPVPQFDQLLEVKRLLSEEKLVILRKFWNEHTDSVNRWAQVPRLYTGPKRAP